MTTTYTIVPIPRWYFADNTGRPAGGAYMATWRSVDKVTQKSIYTDSSGNFPYPNPVFFNANGEAPGPFFWADDEPYFIQVFASDGTLLFTMDNYGPGISGGGGGGTITVNNFLENYVVNNLFLSQNYSTVAAGINTFNNIQSGTVIAPSNHHGFVPGSTGFATIPNVGPDIMFVRSNNSATDNLLFSTTDFNAGNVPLTGDVTPEYYCDLQCTVAGNETLKAIQWPIDLHVKNLEQQEMTAIIWARGISGTQNLTMNFVQYFGTGSATTPVVTAIPISASPLAGSWQSYRATFTPASIAGKTLGSGGDDASYLQVCFPTAALFHIYFTKPKIYLSSTATVFPELQSYDYVDRIINSPRTGDVRISLNTYMSGSWVAANDGSIGSSTPVSGATNRANIDTWPLYSLLWNGTLDHWAPVAGGRGASAIADFAAGKALTLTRALGRVLAGINPLTSTAMTFTTNYAGSHNNLTISSSTTYTTGTPVQLSNTGGALPASLTANTVYFVININATTIQLANTIENANAGTPIDIGGDSTGTSTVQTALGAYVGESLHVLSSAQLPSHTHGTPSGASNFVTDKAGGPGIGGGSSASYQTVTGDVVGGTGQGHNTIQPTTYMNVFYKL